MYTTVESMTAADNKRHIYRHYDSLAKARTACKGSCNMIVVETIGNQYDLSEKKEMDTIWADIQLVGAR